MTQAERVRDMKGMLERAVEELYQTKLQKNALPLAAALTISSRVYEVIRVMQHNLDNGSFDNKDDSLPPVTLFEVAGQPQA